MEISYAAAFAHGTSTNKSRQARAYLTFMLTFDFDPLAPTTTNILLYTQCLANSFKSIASVKNYISGAKTYTSQRSGDTSSFSSPLLANLIKGITKLSLHVPQQAPPIDIHTLKRTCDVFTSLGLEALPAKAVVLITYATLLRQSNTLSPAGYSDGGPHTLRRHHLTDSGHTLWVEVASTKTIYRPQDRVVLPVLSSGGKYCPVLTWREYCARYPAPPEAPAFVYRDGSPVRAAHVISLMRAALTVLGHPAATSVTLHSLRRASAQHLAERGVPTQQIMELGTWKSSAVNAYVPKRLISTAPALISSCLAGDK